MAARGMPHSKISYPAASPEGTLASHRLNSGQQLGSTPYEKKLKREISLWTQHPEYPGSALRTALASAPGGAPPLYRGVKSGRGHWAFDQLNQVINAKPGDIINTPASSWSADEHVARDITDKNTPVPDPQYRNRVVFALDSGAHGLNIEPHAVSDYRHQKEWITGGKLQVTVPPVTDPVTGTTTVHVRQVATVTGDKATLPGSAPGNSSISAKIPGWDDESIITQF